MTPIPIYVAAGHVKRPSQVRPLLGLPNEFLHGITLGSYTVLPRDPNSGTTYWSDGGMPLTTLNALGLPNPGIDAVGEYLTDMVREIHSSKRVARVSVAGFSPLEYQTLAQLCLSRGIYEIELNLGCPNVHDGESQKSPASFSPQLVDEIIRSVYDVTDHLGAPAIALKLSPYTDFGLLQDVASVIADAPIASVQHVVTSNTIPNALVLSQEGRPIIDKRYAGLAGAPLKYVALGQVSQFRELLPDRIGIIGVGGITTGDDVLDMQHAGASGVQIASAFFDSGDPCIFQDIGVRYHELLALIAPPA